jgi:hypothetical protein
LLTWTERILSVPVRTAAVREFLRELSAKGWGDLNGVLATLNDGQLVREALAYWLDNEWITQAPSSPVTALVGPNYSRELTVRRFCGEEEEEAELGEATPDTPPSSQKEGEGSADEDQ